MSETRQVEQQKKKPFEIFTPKEIEDLKLYSQDSTDIQDLFNKFILTMNEGIHNKSIGWHTRIISSMDEKDNPYSGPLEEHHKIELKKSMNRYLETANRLQKDKAGSMESLTLVTAQKTIEKYANVYQNFWDSCVEELFLTFLVNISGKTEQDFQDGAGRSYIYCLLQLQQYTLVKLSLDEERTARIQTGITKVINLILELSRLNLPLLLTETEIQEAHVIRDSLFKKYLTLSDLRQEYELNPSCATYIHLRPEIIIEFAQLIDYVIQKVENESVVDKKFKKNKQAIMHILENKRKELALTMALQEKLYVSFGTDDYIEALSGIIANPKSKFLPHKILFSYLDNQSIQVAHYPSDDAKAPKQIEKLLHSRWRLKYIKLHTHYFPSDMMMDISSRSFSEWKTKQQPEDKNTDSSILFVKTTLVALVESQHIINLRLPDFMVSYLTNKTTIQKHDKEKKSESFIHSFLDKYFILAKDEVDHSYDDLFDFFINKKNDRQAFYDLAQYHEAMKFLMRQIDQGAELYAFFKITEQSALFKHCEFTTTTINNFSALKNLVMGFEKELRLVNSLTNLSPYAKKMLQQYVDVIKDSREDVIHKIEKILLYWSGRLNESKGWSFKASGQFDKFKNLLENIDTMLPRSVLTKCANPVWIDKTSKHEK